jgi:hypothetical protein
MFALSDDDLRRSIVGCADGPASFNAEAARRGMHVVSCDPLYQFGADEIRDRIDATYPEVMEQTRRSGSEFVWREFDSVEELGRARLDAMKLFLDDYDLGSQEKRYVAAELPSLPFAAKAFDLALCSHFLFLYTDHLDEGFHVRALLEMCRVAEEVRVFPLFSLGNVPSKYMEPVTERLRASQFRVSLEPVPYEFQRGANQMLRIRQGSGAASGP